MARRRWSTWPQRFGKSLTKTGGVVGLAGVGISAVGAAVSAPVILIAGGIVVGGTLLYAGLSGLPPRMKSARELVGTQIALETLNEIDPPILRLGIVGYTQAGKTTFLKQALHQPPTTTRTNKVYASVVTLQTAPPTYIALLDGDGKQFAQQFEVAKHSNFLLIFLDHDHGDSRVPKSGQRLEEHDRFLRQLEYHLRQRGPIRRLHLVLNKRDLWENSKGAEELRKWFADHIREWERTNLATQVTADFHSNLIASDMGKVMRVISEESAVI